MRIHTDFAGRTSDEAGLERSVRAYLAACAGNVLTPTQWSDIVGLCALLNQVDGIIDYQPGDGLVIRHRDEHLDGTDIFRCPREALASALDGGPFPDLRPT
jgi:hypothetical protein